MANSEAPICLKCDHPKSEHTKNSCERVTNLGPEVAHGNPVSQPYECNRFFAPKKSKKA